MQSNRIRVFLRRDKISVSDHETGLTKELPVILVFLRHAVGAAGLGNVHSIGGIHEKGSFIEMASV